MPSTPRPRCFFSWQHSTSLFLSLSIETRRECSIDRWILCETRDVICAGEGGGYSSHDESWWFPGERVCLCSPSGFNILEYRVSTSQKRTDKVRMRVGKLDAEHF
jgi:hypothetical protein